MYGMWQNAYGGYHLDHMSGEISTSLEYLVISDTGTASNDLLPEILRAESDLINKNWGLDLSAGYLYNTSAGMDVADNILYKSRIQTQLSWDVLNNGYLENRTKSKILENESLIAAFERDHGNSPGRGDIVDNWHKVIFRFNIEKIALLDQRLELAEKRVEISYQLKSLGKITHEELLNNLESYAEISSLYKIYEDYNKNIYENISLNSVEPLPLIDINYDYGLNQLKSVEEDTLKQLMLSNLDLENRFYNNVDLKLYSRYNYYDLVNNPLNSRSFLTLGVGLGVPIAFNKKEKQELYHLKKLQILNGVQEMDADQVRLRSDLLSYMYEFRYKLKQFNAFYYKKLKMEELLRKEQARFDVNKLDFNPLKALRWLDESMSVDMELIDLKQQLYLYILRMISVEPDLDVSQLIVPLQLDEIEIQKLIKAPKEVYIWSSTIEKHDKATLVNYCVMNNISKVVVSVSADKKKLNEFTASCKEFGVEVDLMIGDNQLMINYSNERLTDKLIGVEWDNVNGLHLDVEPQTFEDWSENKDYYTNEYLKMYSQVAEYCNSRSKKLSVSLPTYFSEIAVQQIQNNGGMVYFMCYENVSNGFLEKKLLQYKGTSFVIALRPEDFSNMIEVEEKISYLGNLLEPNKFIIHDLERLIKFDP